jgi:His/Glu/Gln/Arg/opine family amino acid ABC transporter permease subunit
VTAAGVPPTTPSRPSNRRVLLRRIFSWATWSRIVYGVVAVVFGLLFIIELGNLGVYRLSYALSILKPEEQGFWTTLEVVAVILPSGFGLGFLIGWARTTRFVILRGFGSVYVDFFRSMPPIALIFFFYLIGGIELTRAHTNPYLVTTVTLWLGVVALALHTAAYQAEIVRAGILSVPAGQTEASDAVGISRLRSMFIVTLPQAFRLSLPALGNEFSSSIKDTSLLYAIGWTELSGVSYGLASTSFETGYMYASLIIWLEAAFLYFVVTYIVTRTVRAIEDVYKVPGLEVAR